MAIVNLAYSNTTQITCTLTSILSGSSRECTLIDNTTNKYLDANLQFIISLSNGTVSGDKAIYVYFYASQDGVNFTDNATGTDNTLALRSIPNFKGPFAINTPNNGPLTYKQHIGSVASYFGGVLPQYWGLVVQNTCGCTLLSSSNQISYSGITETVV